MPSFALFSFGYYGWGNHTPHLLEAANAVEAKRGFGPPTFVDIRIRRSVRAAGFAGQAFENMVGAGHHRWMKALGNRFILTRTGPEIQIADPAAAEELLDFAMRLEQDGQRLLFFCSCEWPKVRGQISCHRVTVASLVLAAAKRRGADVCIQEWPGGSPREIVLDVSETVFKSVGQGRLGIPIGDQSDLVDVAALPWCSIAILRCGRKELHRVVGPAKIGKYGWTLPVLNRSANRATTKADCEAQAQALYEALGLGPLT